MAENPKFNKLLEELRDLHERKNDNYARTGDPLSNLKACERIACPSCGTPIPAWVGVAIRLTDKWERYMNLLSGVPDRVGEDVKETVRDQTVYSMLWLLLREEWEAERDSNKHNEKETVSQDT